MEITRCTSIPSAHAEWTEEVGIRFVNPVAVAEFYTDEHGPRPVCAECVTADRLRNSIFTPVWRSAIDTAATQRQTAQWDASQPVCRL